MIPVPSISADQLNDVSLVKKILDKNGLLLVNNFLSEHDLNALVNEFHFILNHKDIDFIKPIDYSEGKGRVVAREKIDKSILPHTFRLFSSPLMHSIANKYLGGEVSLNHDIYVVKDVVGSKHHANDLHFDVLRTFKFFIYLSDTTSLNGAFACVPGSNIQAAEIRRKFGKEISYENRYLTRDLPFTDNDAVPVEGKAGSLIIFDTDLFHKAGSVTQGERWVMRGHSRLMTELKKNRSSASAPKNIFHKLKQFFETK